MKPNKFHFFIETYHTDVYLLWPKSGEALSGGSVSAFLRSKGVSCEDKKDDFTGLCSECSHPTKGHFIVISLHEPWECATPLNVSVLAHECFHAAEFIMERCNIPHSNDTSEAWAYLIDSILRRCLAALAR